MLTFLPIILFFYSHKIHLLFFSMHLLFSILLTGFHTYAYKNLEVVTIRILAFLSGCVLALLKAVCSPLKKVFAVNIRNLLLGMRLQCTWSKEIKTLQCSGSDLIRKVYLLCQHKS